VIQDALVGANYGPGHVPLVAPLNFPPIPIIVVRGRTSTVSGFTGSGKLHIAIDELTSKSKKYGADLSKVLPKDWIGRWVKLQLLTTTVHEISHTVLRAVLPYTIPS
jgi:hypothetical protein